jgi:hypothetical protein
MALSKCNVSIYKPQVGQRLSLSQYMPTQLNEGHGEATKCNRNESNLPIDHNKLIAVNSYNNIILAVLHFCKHS